MPTYHTIYDVAANANSPWRLSLAFLIVAIALIAWRRLMRSQKQPAVRHWIIRGGILILAALAIVAATYEPASKGALRDAIDHGTYQTVEGVVSDYTVADPAKKYPEHFTVQGKDASHYTFILRQDSPGFHQLQAAGSPIHKGDCVRLAVVQGAIAKAEIADHCS
jgi:hypothetical protein